jgi:hypothetical protein
MPNPPPQVYPLMDLPAGELEFTEVGGSTTNWAKEDMSIAFLAGLAAQAGLQINEPQKHDDGIDLLVGCSSALINGVRRCHPRMYVQVKATSRPELSAEGLIFRHLKRERYEMMTDDSSPLPQALIVYVMPDDRSKWTIPGPRHVDFVGHAFFFNMGKAPKLGPDDPMKIVVPFANRLTTSSLVRFYHEAMTLHYAW